ncbi:unnamed protein product [Moneuplotes crassus]|nr:unnamed protein product [Moneuplotes crassus]
MNATNPKKTLKSPIFLQTPVQRGRRNLALAQTKKRLQMAHSAQNFRKPFGRDKIREVFEKISRTTPKTQLINPFFQPKGFKLHLPKTTNPSTNLESDLKNKPDKVKDTKSYEEVPEEKVHLIIDSPNAQKDTTWFKRNFRCSKLKDLKMQNWSRVDSFLEDEFEKSAIEDHKVRTKNRYPIMVPTEAGCFKRDKNWRLKANPKAYDDMIKCEKLEIIKLKKQKARKIIQADMVFKMPDF